MKEPDLKLETAILTGFLKTWIHLAGALTMIPLNVFKKPNTGP